MKRIKIISIIAVASLLPGISGLAQEYLSLDSSLVLAATNNPHVKAAYTRYLAALEKVPQVGSLPDPEVSFGFFIKPMELLGGNQVSDMRVMQMFPWFGTLKTARDEASEMAKAKYELFNAEKAELFFQVKRGWYEMLKISNEIELTKENIGLLQSLEKMALIKFQEAGTGSTGMNNSGQMSSGSSAMNSMGGISSGSGGTSGMGGNTLQSKPMVSSSSSMSSGGSTGNIGTGMQDVLRVKMEILDQQNKLALLNDQLQTASMEFNALLNRDIHKAFAIESHLEPEELPAEKAAVADSILQNNPMLAMIASESNAYEAMGEKAKKMGMPMMGGGLDYMLIQKRDGNTSLMNGKDMVMPMVTVSIPIYRKKYDAMQKEAYLMQESAQLESESLKNDLQVQYRNFVQSLDDAERRMKLNKEQEELARLTTDLLLTGFSNTGAGYEEVLRMQYRVLDYGFKYIEAVTDYNTSVAMAEKLMNAVKR
jgi:outer membrane protein TolC